MAALERYPWPGNVRELENAVERAIALSGGAEELLLVHLLREGWEEKVRPEEAPVELLTLKEIVGAAEKRHILGVLRHTGNHKAQAAGILGISRKNLWEKMTHYGLE